MNIRGAETGEGLNVEPKIPVDTHTHNEWYLEDMKLPDKSTSDIKKEMKDGMLRDDIMANITGNVISTFRGITLERSWPYFGKGLCPAIAKLGPLYSFAICKELDRLLNSLLIRMSVPGHANMRLSTQALHVSRRMYGLEREDVKTFFDYDTFFIEGKTNKEHYITGIHLPQGINNKNYMIKTHMKDGVFYATLPHVKKEEIKIN
ncbi:hypothetical protein Hanom_Chr08g00708411 [Helianthus anomalus]